MKQKEIYVLAIFIFSFLIFLYFTPSYIGYTTTQNVTYTIFKGDINTLQSLQEEPEALEIIETLNLDIPYAISALHAYDLQAQTIEQDTTLNDTEKEEMILNLEIQVDSLLEELPKLLVITNKISGLPATPPPDITPEMLPEGIDVSLIEEILHLQEQVEARTDVKVFTMLTFAEEGISGTYIKKTINAPVQDGYVLEIIPSTILTSEEELNFLGEYEVVNQAPLTLSIKMSNGIALYSYIIPENIFTSIDQIQTAAVPRDIKPIAPIIDVVCGDGICTEYLEDEIICPEDCARKIPWVFIIIIVAILIIGIILTHFFRHKLKNIFRKKELLFKTESDKENLKNYIKASFNEGIAEEQIKTILLAKDWTEKQINMIVNEIREESKPKEEEKPEESKSEETTPEE